MTTILIAEDSPVNKMTCAHILKSAKYCVLTANNGVEALEQLQKEHVDLLISDMVMPQMDGPELVAQIRASETNAHLPIIVLTSMEEESSALQLLADTVEGFLNKPTSSWQLLDTVATALENRHASKIA